MLLQNISLTIQATTDLLFLLVIGIVSILIIWTLVSIPVWISAKILTLGRAKFGRAMLVTAVGPIVYSIVLFNYTVYSVYLQTRYDTDTYAIRLCFAIRIAIGDL